MSVIARLEPKRIDPATELVELLETSDGDGAVVNFVGLARGMSHDGETVDRLILEHHPRLTAEGLETIAADAAERTAVLAPGERPVSAVCKLVSAIQ